ncbi:MAG: DUF2232 domain-containing protein [Bacillota bacterium]|nr:DUF2232 domain-containing protein [Bacillota bacterium]
MYLTVIFLLTLIIPFLVMPKHIKLGILPPYRVVLLSIIGIGVMAAVIMMMASLGGQGLYAQMHEMVKVVSEAAASNPAIVEALSAGDMSEAEITAMLVQFYDAGLLRLPVTILFLGAIVSYVAYIILSRIIGRKQEVKRMPKFREFTFGHGTAMAMMIMYVVSWLMMNAEAGIGEMMYANINMLFDLVFAFQGIAVVMMFFHFKKIPQALAVIVSIVMWVTSIGKMFLVLMGIADLILGLRIRMGGK